MDTEFRALYEVLDDEYQACATHDQVIADFGDGPPYSHVREAEARHVDAMRVLFARYDVPVPESPWPGRVPRYASLTEACAAATVAEIANAPRYDRLLVATGHPDLLTVFCKLQATSLARHLSAFERCPQRGGGGHRRA
jgi:hypothetical protein